MKHRKMGTFKNFILGLLLTTHALAGDQTTSGSVSGKTAVETPAGKPGGAPVLVCAEDAGWPPFSIPGGMNGQDRPDQPFAGLNAEFLAEILGKHDIPYRVVVRPWKRCLKDGYEGDVTIILDAASNPQRQQDYLLTDPIYSLTPVVFYYRGEEESLLPKIRSDDYSGLVVCGQKGYIYDNFGFDNDRVERISEDLAPIMQMLRIGRCDVGLARQEVLMMELNQQLKSSDMVLKPLEGATREAFYWMLNRNDPRSSRLKSLIDSEVSRLYQEGRAQRWLYRLLKG